VHKLAPTALAMLSVLGSSDAIAAATPTTTPIVRTDDGALMGTTTGAMNEFLGIPYAAPPTGALRWQPPAPVAAWHGLRDATHFGANCAQPASPYGIASTSEDCLFLNVYSPRGVPAHSRLPVMVWIHGGAFSYGESNDFDPAPLVAHGIVVVTVNYRLGALGFLADASLGEHGVGASLASAGDYGLLD